MVDDLTVPVLEAVHGAQQLSNGSKLYGALLR